MRSVRLSAAALLGGAALLAAGGMWLLAGAPLPGRSGDDAEVARDTGLDPALVARGSAIYQANCARCHGERGEGQPNWKVSNPDGTVPPPPHDATGHTWHHADGLLYRIVHDGGKIYESGGFKSQMPAWGDTLSPDEIRAVITYLKTLWGPKERAIQAEASRDDPFP